MTSLGSYEAASHDDTLDVLRSADVIRDVGRALIGDPALAGFSGTDRSTVGRVDTLCAPTP